MIAFILCFGIVWPWAIYSISSNMEDIKDMNREVKAIKKRINDIENYKLNIECEILANDERIRMIREGK